MMSSRFFHYFKIVAVIHVAVILAIVFSGGCSALLARRKKNLVVPFEFVVAVPPASTSVPVSATAPVKARPPVQPAKPKTTPATKKHAVKITNERVVRQSTGAKPVQNTLSPEEIERRLKMGAKAGDYNSPVPEGDLLAFTIIKQALYDAWSPPDREVAGNAVAEISVKIAADGSLYARRIDRASRNTALDESVMRAINSVSKIYGLSHEFLKKYANKDISISFKVE